jgi:antitoxin CptB
MTVPPILEDASLVGADRQAHLSERSLSKLRWRSRRGLLENDLFIERFFHRHAAELTVGQARGMYVLMDLSDNDLMDLLLRRKALPTEISTEEVREVLDMLRHEPNKTPS